MSREKEEHQEVREMPVPPAQTLYSQTWVFQADVWFDADQLKMSDKEREEFVRDVLRESAHDGNFELIGPLGPPVHTEGPEEKEIRFIDNRDASCTRLWFADGSYAEVDLNELRENAQENAGDDAE